MCDCSPAVVALSERAFEAIRAYPKGSMPVDKVAFLVSPDMVHLRHSGRIAFDRANGCAVLVDGILESPPIHERTCAGGFCGGNGTGVKQGHLRPKGGPMPGNGHY